ncbi:MAG: winged helix-turn-helix transcriptional regulator [Magnetococcales bacterium]|nr:winged helix-turn-helix transcriptional regulator [Magnetococcales bacterium]
MPKEIPDEAIVRHLLLRIASSSEVRQRDLSQELGIALGLTNAYIKHLIDKGLIKVSQIPAKRYAYYLTPTGFLEKSRLVASYLSHSFQFFWDARGQCRDLLERSAAAGRRRVLFYGLSELVEIAALAAQEAGVELCGVVAPDSTETVSGALAVFPSLESAPPHDAILITGYRQGQAIYETLAPRVGEDRLLLLPLLHITRTDFNAG